MVVALLSLAVFNAWVIILCGGLNIIDRYIKWLGEERIVGG